jgi:hypothetical protein
LDRALERQVAADFTVFAEHDHGGLRGSGAAVFRMRRISHQVEGNVPRRSLGPGVS